MKTTSNPDNPALVTALGYARKGWHVFPLRPGDKRPAFPKHTADNCDGTDPKCVDGHSKWEQRATTDTARITQAWTANPRFGVGIACGPSGLLVVDLDQPKTAGELSGVATFDELVEISGEAFPQTLTVRTPSGGYHLYYHQPDNGEALPNSGKKLGPAIDTRGHGGYVAAPPTTIGTNTYKTIANGPVSPLPEWLHHQLKPTPAPASVGRPVRIRFHTNRYTQAAVEGETSRIRNAPTGQRNGALYVAARSLGELAATEHYNPTDAETDLLNAASTHYGTDGFTETEALKTIRSGLNKGLTQPRQIRKTA